VARVSVTRGFTLGGWECLQRVSNFLPVPSLPTSQPAYLPRRTVGMGFRVPVAGGRHFTNYHRLRAALDTFLANRLPMWNSSTANEAKGRRTGFYRFLVATRPTLAIISNPHPNLREIPQCTASPVA
jgi:hypothetical protein